VNIVDSEGKQQRFALPLTTGVAQIAEMRRALSRGWQLLRHRGPGQIQFWFIGF